MKNIINVFQNVRVKMHEGLYMPNKPLLLLIALARCQKGNDRLAPFHVYEESLALVSQMFGKLNVVYPFGRLPADGIWEIVGDSELLRNNSGDLIRSELLEQPVLGGFTIDVYDALSRSDDLAKGVAIKLLETYIPPEKRKAVISAFGILVTDRDKCPNEQEFPTFVYRPTNKDQIDAIEAGMVYNNPKVFQENAFISYLNSLHNLNASGSNALAESQALSPYFGELYMPFPLVNKLAEIVTDGVPRVAIVTGHAGDGKSTLALDVLKKLRALNPTDPLGQPMNERENIDTASGSVSIVKDMSELSAERRQEWLRQAFKEPGSWLIISNTGPLLSSLTDYARTIDIGQEIESDILDRLNRPLDGARLDTHTLGGFDKELVILNLTRWDNLELVPGILSRLVNHTGWEECDGCTVETACPLMLNRMALREAESVVGERVRWIYQRLSAYEQRLTLRQIVAQLAIGLTGGMSCNEAHQQVGASTADGLDRGSAGLEQIIFSEGFFGYRGGKPWPEAEGLHAVALVRRATFGAPVGADFERRLSADAGIGWAIMPPSLKWLSSHWRQRAEESAGVRWRFALRRMAYLFGEMAQGENESAAVFLDTFVQSPSLRNLDSWQAAGKLTLTHAQANRLRTSCLRVLVEVFSGFSPSQFQSQDALYLTLRRPDRAVVQPTQLVIETLRFQDFNLDFDPIRRLPALRFKQCQEGLLLTLPLLDYIRRRDAGELGNALSPIHQAQLDWFRAELLQETADTRQSDDEISLLRAGIDGEVHLHRFLLDQDHGILEQSL